MKKKKEKTSPEWSDTVSTSNEIIRPSVILRSVVELEKWHLKENEEYSLRKRISILNYNMILFKAAIFLPWSQRNLHRLLNFDL